MKRQMLMSSAVVLSLSLFTAIEALAAGQCSAGQISNLQLVKEKSK